MNIKYGKSKRITASEDYATLRGMDFRKARDILTKDGFHEHEYGDKDDNNGYAVYRKGDKEVELQYRWNQGKRKGEAHAGKVTNVYVDDDINSACDMKPVKAATSGKIPYDLVSTLIILRDYADVEDAYINSEHKDLVDVADTLYNVGKDMVDQLSPKYKAVYDKYGKAYFDKVLKDANAIDSQISRSSVNDLISEYEDKANAFEGGINSSCGKKSVKAAFRDNTIDKDAVRELVLTITNDGDQYRRQITPAIDNLKRKYKKGAYDRDLAVKLWQYVADEGVRRYNKEFGSGTASVAWLNPATRKAIAEELRDYYEDEIMYDDSVEASRRAVKAARTLEIYTYDELTPEQQAYVLENWSDMRKLAEVIYDWYNEDIMFGYQDEKQYIADKYANQYGLSINPDKLYWQSNSQGPYPEWDLSQVFDEYQLNDGTEIYFYGRGLDVEAETDSWGEEVESPEIDEVVGHAQEYIDEMWKYINDVCQAYPDDEWVEGTMESNPDAFEFTISDSGEVKYY